MNHICTLTLSGGSDLLFKLEDQVEKAGVTLEFRGNDLGAMAESAILALGTIRLLPATPKKKAMVLVGPEMVNQVIAGLKDRSHQHFDITGDINGSWKVYNVPPFNVYDKTITV